MLCLIAKRIFLPQWKTTKAVVFFCICYLGFIGLILPSLASLSGRQPLPVFSKGNLKPAHYYTVILNRHYVKHKLHQSVQMVSQKMKSKHPNLNIYYLDAGFPFLDKMPLIPHLSHGDGKKLDFCFVYKNVKNKKLKSGNRSILGYGDYEAPLRKEGYYSIDNCKKKNDYYDFPKVFPSKFNSHSFELDNSLSKELLIAFASEKSIDKILLEPHLKQRWGLQTYDKIRFHGCKAVRHDDHFHIQVR